MDPGDSPISPIKNTGSVPKEWKIRPEKHKKLEDPTDDQDVIVPHNRKALDKDFQIKHTMRKQEGIRYPCDHPLFILYY